MRNSLKQKLYDDLSKRYVVKNEHGKYLMGFHNAVSNYVSPAWTSDLNAALIYEYSSMTDEHSGRLAKCDRTKYLNYEACYSYDPRGNMTSGLLGDLQALQEGSGCCDMKLKVVLLKKRVKE